MPLYPFRCSAGHVTDRVYPMRARRPATVRCSKCGKRAKRIYTLTAVVPDFPEHFNWSMGCIVKNRAHHKQIQRERGLQDWEPVKESPGLSKLRKEGYL